MIYFVGAGSGAPDLITVRGAKLLGEADVIVYAGSLVNPALLDYAKEGLCDLRQRENDARGGHRGHGACGACGKDGRAPAHRRPLRLRRASRADGRARQTGACIRGLPGRFVVLRRSGGAQGRIYPAERQPDGHPDAHGGPHAVPEREQIESLAAHGATMVIFLSAGQLEKLSARLIEGGYAPETPAAIVYKATWPDEKVVRTTVGELAAAGAREGITKTALITVGGFLGDSYDRSKLYDPAFTTGFREASR